MIRSQIERFCRAVLGWLVGGLLLCLLGGTLALARSCKIRRKRTQAGLFRILLTGRFDSKNWGRSHLVPLSRTPNISELLVVVDGTVETVPKARQFIVPRQIGWIKPRAIIRSLWAVRVALLERPDVIMAYSFFPPGVFGLIAARLTGATAIVQLAGGPREIEAGGWVVDDRPLIPEKIKRWLVPLCQKLCGQFDVVVVRGRNAEKYVHEHSHPSRVAIIPGSVDPGLFRASSRERSIDVVFVGRIDPIKQPHHVCEIIQRVARRHPGLRVVVAGRGQLGDKMRRQAQDLGLQKTIRFAGHVERVEGLLARSRIFLLTSRSEGLSIAMAEAMMGGSVPVVPDVGDLNELVVQGKTGWLIKPGDFDAYADKICDLLGDPEAWQAMSQNARALVLNRNSINAVAGRWDELLMGLDGSGLPLVGAVRRTEEVFF